MKKAEYGVFEALNPFFEIVLRGLSGLVDGEHYFDTIADSAIFESRYHFPGLACDDSRTSQFDGQPLRIRQDDQASLRACTGCTSHSG